jgi:hypothetical protein
VELYLHSPTQIQDEHRYDLTFAIFVMYPIINHPRANYTETISPARTSSSKYCLLKSRQKWGNQENRKEGNNEQSSTCTVLSVFLRAIWVQSLRKTGDSASGEISVASLRLHPVGFTMHFRTQISTSSVKCRATTSRGERKMAAQKGGMF